MKEDNKQYIIETLKKAVKSVKMHDKDEFMLLNIIEQLKDEINE